MTHVPPSLGDGEIPGPDQQNDRKRRDDDEKTNQGGFREDHDIASSNGVSIFRAAPYLLAFHIAGATNVGKEVIVRR
jgi:hypothetical protein